MLPSLPVMTDSAGFSWTVLLPVKVLARAKSRLTVLAGDRRRELALAFASDTVAAVLACPEVARVLVVTSDPVAGPLLAGLGAIIVADEPAAGAGQGGRAGLGSVEGGSLAGVAAEPRVVAEPRVADEPRVVDELGLQDALNAALRHGAAVAARRWPGTGLAALTADLPALNPDELAAALRRTAASAASASGAPGSAAGPPIRAAFVPDAAGVGTTLYAVPPGGEFRPLFGGASRARHAASGAVELEFGDMAGLRRDVDTPDDLRAALTLGAGKFTQAAAVNLFTDV
jgi:2-phospho-L-lactate/phosphoenolpyruvate guanylyltransferase